MKPILPLGTALEASGLTSFLSSLIIIFMVLLIVVLVRQNKLLRKYKELSDKFKD